MAGKGNRGFKMNNPMSQIANTKSHGTNANYMKSGINTDNMKDSPVEWAWLGTAAKAVGKAATTVGKTIGKGAKALVGAGGKKAAGAAVKEGAKKAVKEGVKEGAKKTLGKKIKEQAMGAARDVVTSAATDALKPKEEKNVNPTAGFNVKFGN